MVTVVEHAGMFPTTGEYRWTRIGEVRWCTEIANKACMYATGPCCLLAGCIYSNHSEVYIDGSPYFGNNFAESGGEKDQLQLRQLHVEFSYEAAQKRCRYWKNMDFAY